MFGIFILTPASQVCGLHRSLTGYRLLPLQCDPPLEVKDLFLDIQDGKILMALLEVLSGRSLVRKSLKGQEEAPAAKDSAQGVLSVQECGCAHLDVHTSYTENFGGGPSFMGD